MKETAKKIVEFIKNNPSILYSLILIIFIPVAIFLNTFIISNNFQKNIDVIIQRKAVLIENILDASLKNKLTDQNELQILVEKIQKDNSEISYLSIIRPNQEKEEFAIIASTKPETINSNLIDIQKNQALLAWNNQEGIAFLDGNGQERFWNITKYLTDENNKKTALISLSFSLAESDNLINTTINNSYIILILTILVVILLVANHTRLFGYAISLEKGETAVEAVIINGETYQLSCGSSSQLKCCFASQIFARIPTKTEVLVGRLFIALLFLSGIVAIFYVFKMFLGTKINNNIEEIETKIFALHRLYANKPLIVFYLLSNLIGGCLLIWDFVFPLERILSIIVYNHMSVAVYLLMFQCFLAFVLFLDTFYIYSKIKKR